MTPAAECRHFPAELECQLAEWIQPEPHTKGTIDRAGEFLAGWWGEPLPRPTVFERDDDWRGRLASAWGIAQNWRASHAYSLNAFTVNLKARARRVENKPLVAQRLKRISSVLKKLVRFEKMPLSQMQDLGGCRAILSDLAVMNELAAMYRGDQGDQGALFESESHFKCTDYVVSPKPDGYRGIHLVGRFVARATNREPWNGQRIEIQLRSKLQHTFATTVETVTTFTREPLKFGGGNAQWKRFFALTGSAFAIREGTTLVPNTPTTEEEIIKELRELTKELRVRHRLRGWRNALKTLRQRNVKEFKWLLLVLNIDASTIKVTGFADRQKAATAVAELEQRGDPNLDAVLVWVQSVLDLRRAYPNYYADTHEFVKALDVAVNQG